MNEGLTRPLMRQSCLVRDLSLDMYNECTNKLSMYKQDHRLNASCLKMQLLKTVNVPKPNCRCFVSSSVVVLPKATPIETENSLKYTQLKPTSPVSPALEP